MRQSASAARDPIDLVEACYDLSAPERQWLQTIADIARPLMHAQTLIAYHVGIGERGYEVRDAVQSGDAHGDVAARIIALGDVFDRKRAGQASLADEVRAKVSSRVFDGLLSEAADRLLLSERQPFGPRWAYTLGAPGVRDLLFLINRHIDLNGATFMVGSLDRKAPLPPARRLMLLRLGAHIKAGWRLRQRLPAVLRSVDASEHGAVLDASARVVHAHGEAQSTDVRALLEQKARAIDGARTRKNGRDENALAVWEGLVDGRWSLVERFDVDGRRFILAHKNPEEVVDPRGLSSLEARVTALAARGYSDKLVAYHLGIAEGTVASHLARAMRKLGITSRVELLRALGNAPLDHGGGSEPGT